MNDRASLLQSLLAERILVLDGAMGTMIQRERLTEEQFRGERFRGWGRDLRGNNDLLTLTQPALIRRLHLDYLDAGVDIIETNTFNSTSVSLGDYGMEELAYELNLAAAHARARRRGRMAEARPLAAALRRRRDRPDHQDRVDLARRQRPGLPQRQLRCAGRRLRRRAARPDRRRRRPGAGRDHLRHAQRQGGAVRDRERVRTARRAPAADHFRHHHRRLGPHAVGPDHRGVLQLGAPCAIRSRWA